MKRRLVALAVVCLSFSSLGCMAISAKNNRLAADRGVVAMDGNVYLIHYDTGRVQKIDLCAAEPYKPPTADDAAGDQGN